MEEELRVLKIEKCSSSRTKFFVNGRGFRASPDTIKDLFSLTAAEMNKLFLGYLVERKYPNSKCMQIVNKLVEITRLHTGG